MKRELFFYVRMVMLLLIIMGGTTFCNAQKIYFVEQPAKLISQNNPENTFIVEYSAKNYGSIALELWHQDDLVAKGICQVRKRGSNTAHIKLTPLDSTRELVVSDGYRYELSLYETESYSATQNTKAARSGNYGMLATSFQASTASDSTSKKPKRVSLTTIEGVKVIQ